jgi:RimJ/RimL family protein N-acetyltransferase
MLITNRDFKLENNVVILRLFGKEDISGFINIFSDDEIWKYTVSKVQNEKEIIEYYKQSEADFNNGTKYTFSIFDKSSGRLAGTSSYGNISEYDRRLEIGWSYLGTEFWGSGINPNYKYLMLKYAFENLKMKRVEFKTDFLNGRARKALLKIGCREEGILRSHTLMHDGRRRDAVFYSILDSDWENIK